jgi:hypothetical protein
MRCARAIWGDRSRDFGRSRRHARLGGSTQRALLGCWDYRTDCRMASGVAPDGVTQARLACCRAAVELTMSMCPRLHLSALVDLVCGRSSAALWRVTGATAGPGPGGRVRVGRATRRLYGRRGIASRCERALARCARRARGGRGHSSS